MRKILFLGLLLLLSFSILPIGVLALGQERVPVIIMFREKRDSDLVRNLGGKIRVIYKFKPAVAAIIPEKAIEALKRNPNVKYVVPDLQIELVGEILPWGVERIGAQIVHASGNKGSGVNVAVLDTGIDTDHPDLTYVWGYDFSGDNDPDPEDYDGHGTHVAGIIVALDNEIGVVGVAPEVNLYILKIFTDDGSGSYSDAVEALEWCIGTYYDNVTGNEIQIISMSWGSRVEYGDPGIEPWINEAYSLGIVLVGAAGNEGNPPGKGDNVIYPARYENVIAVAATDESDNRAKWSSTGPAVELSAPGVNILSTYLDGRYAYASGTSMAAPHVSGTIALLLCTPVDDYDSNGNGRWDPNEVRAKLQNTADDLGSSGWDSKYGYGLVDADEACGEVSPPPPQPEMHVESIDFSTKTLKNGREVLVVTIKVLDVDGSPVQDATVYGTLTLPDGATRNYSGETGTDGTVVFEYSKGGKPGPLLSGTYKFCVTNIVKEGWTYNPSENKETCDSWTKP